MDKLDVNYNIKESDKVRIMKLIDLGLDSEARQKVNGSY